MNPKFLIIICTLLILNGFFFARSFWVPIKLKVFGKKTSSEIISLYGTRVRNELKPLYKNKNINYPPDDVTLIAFKEEKILEVWAKNNQNINTYIHSYPIAELSGENGPKLREGDFQVPEGFYKIIGLNPNSSYHLSMKLNYPNEFDLSHAKIEGRTEPGTNIFIHGKSVSVGCLAMGDKTIEELFVLAKDVGIKNISVIISPYDPREKALIFNKNELPKWTNELYKNISTEIIKFNKTL